MTKAIVLAAGASRRMGRPKLALPLGSGTVLSAALAPLLASTLEEIVVVLGCDAEGVRAAALSGADPRLRFVMNDAWPTGMAGSIRAGLLACFPADAVLIALADKVGVTQALVAALLEAARGGASLVVPIVGGRASHPVLVASTLFDELLVLEGDVGARAVVRRHLAEAVRVPGVPLHDLDDEVSYEALLRGDPPAADDGLPIALEGDQSV